MTVKASRHGHMIDVSEQVMLREEGSGIIAASGVVGMIDVRDFDGLNGAYWQTPRAGVVLACINIESRNGIGTVSCCLWADAGPHFNGAEIKVAEIVIPVGAVGTILQSIDLAAAGLSIGTQNLWLGFGFQISGGAEIAASCFLRRYIA